MAILNANLGSFNVRPVRSLAWRTQPTRTAPGEPITPAPAVEVRTEGVFDDQIAQGEIAVALGNAEEGGVLSGPTVAPVVGGVAEFPGLSVDLAGEYSLIASVDEDALGYGVA